MRTVATLLFPDFEMLDVYGPLEMFGMFPDEFRLVMIAEGADPVASAQGPRTAVDATLAEAGVPDILLVPGGRGTRREVENADLLAWLADTAPRSGIVASVCTGAALLARAGLLDGRRATSNKRAFDWVAAQGPETEWEPAARWVEDGDIFTASGVSAGIDMALAVIARLLGADAASNAAVWAEYTANTDSARDPFAVLGPDLRETT